MRRRPPTRVTALPAALLALAAALLAFGTAVPDARADCTVPSTMWEQALTNTTSSGGSITSGQVAGAFPIPNMNVTAGTVTKSCTANGVATITGTISLTGDPTPINVTITYKDNANWTLTVAGTPTGSTYLPPTWSAVDLRHLQGTIADVNGSVAFGLKATGFVLGNQTMDLTIAIDKTTHAWAGSATLSTVKIGGLTINQASIATTSTGNTAAITGNMTFDGGTFAAGVIATGMAPSSAASVNPYKWGLAITLSGANLNGASPTVTFTSFSATAAVSQADATTCINVQFNAQATWRIQSRDYKVNDFTFKVQCGKFDHFVFSMTVSHYTTIGGLVEATLTLTWVTPSSVAYYWTEPWGQKLWFYGGFYGGVDLSYSRHFSDTYESSPGIKHTFSRDVTTGVGLTTGMVQWAAGQTTYSPMMVIGGYLTADRLGGDLYCGWYDSGTDFVCSADFTWNPEDAGKYHHHWDGL